jgi:hypothetical protein
MRGRQHPYRITARRRQLARAPVDPLVSGQRLARGAVLGWAFLRVVVCSMRGMDFEGFLALVIVVTAVASPTRSFA